MYEKALFTPEEIRGIFSGTDSQKYSILKKDLANIITRFLLANPQIKSKNENIYEKAIASQVKNILHNPATTTKEEVIKLAEMTALSDVNLARDSYDSQWAMQLVMNLFLTLE